jgi:hypothetical protein
MHEEMLIILDHKGNASQNNADYFSLQSGWLSSIIQTTINTGEYVGKKEP